MSILEHILYLINILGIPLLILLVLVKNKDFSYVRSLFIIVSILSLSWIILNYYTYYLIQISSTNSILIDNVNRIDWALAIFIPLFVLFLVLEVTKQKIRNSSIFYKSLLGVTILISVLTSIPGFILGEVNSTNFTQGRYYYIYVVIFFVLMMTSFVLLLKRSAFLSQHSKVRNILLLLAIAVPYVISTVTIFLLPPIHNNFEYINLGPQSVIIFITLTSYAIFKYQLLDIQIVIRKTFIYSFTLFSTLILLTILALLLGQTIEKLFATNYIVTLLIIIVAIAIGFAAIHRFLEKYLSRIIFKQIYTLRKILYSLSDIVKQNDSIYDIAQKSINLLTKRLSLTGGVYYSWSGSGKKFIEEYAQAIPNLNLESTPKQSQFANELRLINGSAFDNLHIPKQLKNSSFFSALSQEIDTDQVLVYIPIQKQTALVGLYIFIVDEKTPPSRNEVKLFEAFAGQSASALENAQLHSEKRDFKKLLRQTTESATKKANEARQKLEAVLDTRSQFFVDVAHELKTPLTILQGNVDLAFKNSDLEEAETIQRELTRMNKLTNELIELSRIESGDVPLDREKINLANLLEDLLLEFDILAKAKNIDISLDINPDIQIEADRSLLEKAVSNLISNALKYSKKDTAVTIFGLEDKDSITIEVVDQGVGIEPNELEKIWDRFYRVDKQKSRVKGGTGLGLPIVKLITELHGGSVKAESTINQGSAFTLIFPKKIPQKVPKKN